MNRSVRRRNDCRWSELPPELLSSIADRLLQNNPSDVQQFRGVCKNWKTSVKPPYICLSPISNAIHLYITNSNKEKRYVSDQVPVPTAVYLLHPRPRPRDDNNCRPWLVGVDQVTRGKLRLVHPLTLLPYEAIPENFPRTFINVDAQEITKGFDLRHIDFMKYINLGISRDDLFSVYFKVLVWPNPRLRFPGVKDCKILKLIWQEIKYGTAADIDRTGYPNRKVNGLRLKIDDIILWNRVVWGVDRKGRLYELDYGSMSVNTITATANFVETDEKFGNKRLLQYEGELYMVTRQGKNMRRGKAFLKVYKLDKEYRTWEYVENLDDKVLFLTVDTCFFAPAIGLLNSYRNCSVFPVVNTLNNDKFEIGMCRYGQGANFTIISSQSDMSYFFWPPPKWIMELTSSKPSQIIV